MYVLTIVQTLHDCLNLASADVNLHVKASNYHAIGIVMIVGINNTNCLALSKLAY